jgi:F-type H+-transporting ATPase subunit delta
MAAVVELIIIEQGYEKATLVSARPLTEAQEKMFLNKLETLWRIKIHPEFRVNPNLIAGLIIQRGDKLYDCSVNGQLSKIKAFLMEQETIV